MPQGLHTEDDYVSLPLRREAFLREKRIWLAWREKAQKQAKTPKVTPGGVPWETLTPCGFEGTMTPAPATFNTKTAPTGASMTPGGGIPQPLETTRVAGRCDWQGGAERPPAFILL